MYLFFEEGHLHSACISNKSPGRRLQAGLDAALHAMRAVLRNVVNKGLDVLLEIISKSRNRDALSSEEVFARFGLNNTLRLGQ